VLTLAATNVQDRNPLLPQCVGTHPEGIFGTWFKEPHDHLHDLHNFTTCAVVGGGKSDKEWGAVIDANSAVFRFNDAPTQGFESLVTCSTIRIHTLCQKLAFASEPFAGRLTSLAVMYARQVGSKTTMRTQNRQYCGYAEKSEWCVYYSKSSKEDKGKNLICNQQMQAGHKKAGGKCVHPLVVVERWKFCLWPLSWCICRCVELDPNPGALDFGSNYWKQFPKPQSTTGNNNSLAPRPVCTSQQTAMKRAIEGIEERAKRQNGKAARPASSKAKLAHSGRALLALVAAKRTKTARVRMAVLPRKSHRTARKSSAKPTTRAKPTTSELLAMGGKSLREHARVLRKAVKSGEIEIPVCAPAKVSAGFYGVLLATQLCAEVNLYLFTGTASHYYVKVRGGRQASAVADVRMRLRRRIRRPSDDGSGWTLTGCCGRERSRRGTTAARWNLRIDTTGWESRCACMRWTNCPIYTFTTR